MIVQINNYTNYKCDIDTLKLLSHDHYPKQDKEKLNKLILLRFKDKSISINNRFFIDKKKYTSYTKNNEGNPIYFLILRYDIEPPYTVILMNDFGQIVLSNKSEIESLAFPPDYKQNFTKSEYVSKFKDREELFFSPEITYEEFLRKYENEKVYQIRPQNNDIIGNICYTEYYTDIMKTNASSNILAPSREKTFNEIKEELLKNNPNFDVIPDEILKSFPIFYNKREQDYVDKPLRVINSGIIIRADEHTNGSIVVAENYNGKLRFITNRDAFIYTEYEKKSKLYSEISNFNLIGDGSIIYKGENE